MLARVAIALRRAGALAIAGIRTNRRNIIVPRKSGWGTPFMCLGDGRFSGHARIIRPVCGVFDKVPGVAGKSGFNHRFSPRAPRIQNFCTERGFLF
jgi:hypothetical protein